MYRIDRKTNNVEKLDERLFKDLKIREREHLQEWIAKNPDMLDEDLLIIQKEYAGFNDTNERLDLLAVDKEGGLVVIENKLDDTGRNVVWQALKYASYCSTLNTQQIIRIFQEYLDKYVGSGDAKELLLEFVDRDEDDLLLNRKDQRIIFIANQYRKEVTSTVLWLLKHDIQVQCFKATPYSMDEESYLQMEQIIPLPETKEFMIDAQRKEKEEKEVSKAVAESEARLVTFWNQLKEYMAEQELTLFESIKSKPSYSLGFTKNNGYYACVIGKDAYRVELYISNDGEKTMFDKMARYKDEIERKIPGLIWQRLEGKKASRIKLETSKIDPNSVLMGKFRNEEIWPELKAWYTKSMKHFYEVIAPYWERVQKQ
jgi:hypothetical protein